MQNKNLLPVRVPVWKAKTTTTKILGNENAKQEKKTLQNRRNKKPLRAERDKQM